MRLDQCLQWKHAWLCELLVAGLCQMVANNPSRPYGSRALSPAVQVANLSRLRHLTLYSCDVSEESLHQLAALPLSDLDVMSATLPPCLSQLTRLTSLAVSAYNADELSLLDTALACLSELQLLALSFAGHGPECRLPSGVTALRSLRRLYMHRAFEATVIQQPLPGGPWLASLRWLVRAMPMLACCLGERHLCYVLAVACSGAAMFFLPFA